MSWQVRLLHEAYWLIGGDPRIGYRWCLAHNSKRAMTVYRHIDPRGKGTCTKRGTKLYIAGLSLVLAEKNEYWTRETGQRSVPSLFESYGE